MEATCVQREQPSEPSPPRDPFLLSRKGCVAWTTLGVLSVVCALNALLRLARSKFAPAGGPDFAELSYLETLALATPLVAGVQFLFLWFTRLHARAREQASLPAGYPPAFAVDWSRSLAVGIGRVFLWAALLLPTLAACVLYVRTLAQPLHDSGGQVAAPFQSLYRADLMLKPAFWDSRIYLGGKGRGYITFYPVILPLAYGGLILWNCLATVRLARSHRGCFAPLTDYEGKES